MATIKESPVRFVFPNLVTCIGMSFGIVSIFLSTQGRPVQAAWLVALCVLLDKADGAVARLLNAGSEFGVQLDSLSDLITFNVAPAVMLVSILSNDPAMAAWHWTLALYATAVVYVLCGALRLARFNCGAASGSAPKKFFVGVPTTMAGSFMATLFLTLNEYLPVERFGVWLMPAMLLMAMLMVSNFYLPKLNKERKYSFIKYFQIFNLIAAPILAIIQKFPEYLFALAFLYIAVGLFWSNRRSVVIE